MKWLVVALLMSTACRTEKSVSVNEWLTGEQKKPPSGMIQLFPANTVLRVRGKVVADGGGFWALNWGRTAVLRDDGAGKLIVVSSDGNVVDLHAQGCRGMAIAPEFYQGIDCWLEGSAETFNMTRFDSAGARVFSIGAPASLGAVGQVGFAGYRDDVKPVVAYHAVTKGVPVCRAALIGQSAEADVIAELPNDKPAMGCIIALHDQLHGLSSAARWEQVGR